MFCSSSVSGGVKAKTSKKEVLCGILKKIPKSRKYSRNNWSTVSRQRLRSTLQVPFIGGLYFSKLKVHQNARSVYNSGCLLKCSCLDLFYCCLLCVVVKNVISLIYSTATGHCMNEHQGALWAQ